jgi:amidohydrolase
MRRLLLSRSLLAAVLLAPAAALAQSPGSPALDRLHADIATRTAQVTPKVVAWREDIHEHPELGTQEVRTSKLVADCLAGAGR